MFYGSLNKRWQQQWQYKNTFLPQSDSQKDQVCVTQDFKYFQMSRVRDVSFDEWCRRLPIDDFYTIIFTCAILYRGIRRKSDQIGTEMR